MSMVAGGPLNALIRYYERLEADPAQSVADFGFSRQQISFQVVLESDGRLHGIQDARDDDGRQKRKKSMVVPGQSKPSGQGYQSLLPLGHRQVHARL